MQEGEIQEGEHRSPSSSQQLREPPITAAVGHRVGEKLPHQTLPITKGEGVINIPSILITAEAVSNKAGPFIQVYHCFPDSRRLIINSFHRWLI